MPIFTSQPEVTAMSTVFNLPAMKRKRITPIVPDVTILGMNEWLDRNTGKELISTVERFRLTYGLTQERANAAYLAWAGWDD